MNANRDGRSGEIVRAGYRITTWIEGDFVVLRARPLGPPRELAGLQEPALPSRSRLLIWGGRCGIIRDRLRPRTRGARLTAWLRGRRCLTPGEQLDILVDELLTAIATFEPADPNAWVAHGEQVLSPRGARETESQYLSGRPITYGGQALARITIAAGALGVGVIGALLLFLAVTGPGGDEPTLGTSPAEIETSNEDQPPVGGDAAEESPDDATARPAGRPAA